MSAAGEAWRPGQRGCESNLLGVPPYLRDAAVWANVWPPILGAGVVAGILWLIARRQWFLVLYAFAMLGFVTGLLMGNSRTPAVGVVVPGILTLVGGLTIYMLTKEIDLRAFVAACVVGLSISLWVGAMWGAVLNDAETRDPSKPPRQPGVTPPVTIPPGESPPRMDLPAPGKP